MNGPDFTELSSILTQTGFGEGEFGAGGFGGLGETINTDDEINSFTTWTEVNE
jgi:hypothetical protein